MRTWLAGLAAALVLAGCASIAPSVPEDDPLPSGEARPVESRRSPLRPVTPSLPGIALDEDPGPGTPAPNPPARGPGPEAAGPDAGPEPPGPDPDPPAPSPPEAPPRAIAVTSVPRTVRFMTGADAPDGTFLTSLTLGSGDASFDAVLQAVPNATLRIDSLVRLTNGEGTIRNATLSSDPWTDARIVRAALVVAGQRLDLAGAQPSLALALAPGVTWDVGLELELGSAAPGGPLLSHSVVLAVS